MKENKTVIGFTVSGLIVLIYFMYGLFTNTSAQDTSGDWDVLVGGHPDYYAHDMDVMDSFIYGYESYNNASHTGALDYIPLMNLSLFQYAQDNGYEIVLYSYGNANYYSTLAGNYPDVLIFMPAGSNSFVNVFYQDIETCLMVITGAGATTNVTGYSIEFHSIDPVTTSNLSSFSNGYIAGQVAFIAEYLEISFQEARLVARETGSRNGVWDTYSGYGLIDVDSAVPVELVSFTAIYSNGVVELQWETATEINNYGFEIERDGKVIKFIEGNGNSNSPKYYSFIDTDINRSGTYAYRLKQIDNDGTYEYFDEVFIEVNIPNDFILSQNYPNPFNPETTIEFTISKPAFVSLRVYDMLGNEVAILVNERVLNNINRVQFDGSALTSGIYIYRLAVGDFVSVKKMTLLK